MPPVDEKFSYPMNKKIRHALSWSKLTRSPHRLNGQHNTGKSTLPINASSSQPYQSWKKKRPRTFWSNRPPHTNIDCNSRHSCHLSHQRLLPLQDSEYSPARRHYSMASLQLSPHQIKGVFLGFLFSKIKNHRSHAFIFIFFSTIWLLQLMHPQSHTNIQIN